MFFQAEGLVKAFGALRAVDDVAFTVTQGEILGIAGPNGSGKSTLFNIITNIPFRADAGRVVFEGHALHHRTGHAISRLGLARTFQRESIFPSLSAIDNVLAAVEHSRHAAGRRGNEHRAEAALDLVGFPATMHNSLSGNLPIVYRKLVMIAAALALEPRLLLLDEPAASLTPAEIERVRALILQLRAQGMTIVLIEHVLPLLTSVSDRLLVLDRGKVISQGTPAAVVADPLVVEAYLGVAGK